MDWRDACRIISCCCQVLEVCCIEKRRFNRFRSPRPLQELEDRYKNVVYQQPTPGQSQQPVPSPANGQYQPSQQPAQPATYSQQPPGNPQQLVYPLHPPVFPPQPPVYPPQSGSAKDDLDLPPPYPGYPIQQEASAPPAVTYPQASAPVLDEKI